MKELTVAASKLRTNCYALVNRVATKGITLIITKRGRPIAKVTPIVTHRAKPTPGS